MAKILIVDDEEQIRFVLRELLKRDGHDVIVAQDGYEAYEIATDDIDLIVTDIVMPRRTGLELIDDIKAKCPGMNIIVMFGGATCNGEPIELDEVTLGVNKVMQKPFHGLELRQAINEIIPHKCQG